MNLIPELIAPEKKSNIHFSKIASNYKELRTTDIDHIKYIKNHLGKESKINIADIACGSGTLLKACLDDFVEKHINECVGSNVKPQTDKLVKQLVEKNKFISQ